MTDVAKMTITFAENGSGPRRCGECTLCCKLMPMDGSPANVARGQKIAFAMLAHGLIEPKELNGILADFDKPAGCRCPHQRSNKGCAVYARRPIGCRTWSCAWLSGEDTHDLRRPDRSRYCIDVNPDFITTVDDKTGERTNIQVVQIWLDPKAPDAWRDPALLAYLDRRGKEGIAAIIRLDELRGFTLIPPSMSGDGEWKKIESKVKTTTRTPEERIAGVLTSKKVMFESE